MSEESQKSSEGEFKGVTHIAVVLDKSGSMGVVRQETIGGFNAWLDAMKKAPGEARLTLTLFDTSFVTPIQGAAIEKVNPLDETRYRPDGATALLDAVARTVVSLSSNGGKSDDRYLVCIVTDGQENSSHEYTKESLMTLIREKEALGNWTFTYLSASPDAFADAASIGVAVGNTQAYTPDSVGTEAAFMSHAMRSTSLRSSNLSASASFYGGESHAESGRPGLRTPGVPSYRRRPSAPPPPIIPTSLRRSAGWTTDDPADASSAGGGLTGWVRP